MTDKVLQVLEAARAAHVRVFHTRHMSLPKELMGVSQFRMAMAWQRLQSADDVKPWFLRDSPGFRLIPEVNPLPSEAIFDKIAMSAFEGTPLNMALRDCAIAAFAIVGIAMEIGIEPTVRHGADLGYIPVVIKDACGFGHRGAAGTIHREPRIWGRCRINRRRDLLCLPSTHSPSRLAEQTLPHVPGFSGLASVCLQTAGDKASP